MHTLVFGGGGAKMYAAACGVVRVLEEQRGAGPLAQHYGRFVGSSMGSVVATFLALGMTSHEMRSRGERLAARVTQTVDIEALFTSFGLDTAAWLTDTLRDVLEEKLGDAEVSLRGLADATGKHLVVRVTDFDAGEVLCLGADSDVPVHVAVRASCALPFLLTPVKHTVNGTERMLVDGSLLRDFDTDELARDDALVVRLGHSRARTNRRNLWGYVLGVLHHVFGGMSEANLASASANRDKVLTLTLGTIAQTVRLAPGDFASLAAEAERQTRVYFKLG